MIIQDQDNDIKMTTQYISYRTKSDLDIPAQLIAQGEVVAFPTETVYGLGAGATNASAIRKIYVAKGRPQDNPLIVHVAHSQDIIPLVKTISPLAQCLIDAFMPGPITLVMPKSDAIPKEVSAGLDTVGIRIPANSIARELIKKAGVPVAAPSANISGRPSPTQATHVKQDLNGKIACILDAGPCEVGLESSVVDVTGEQPCILRPGAITSEMIEDVCQKCGIYTKKDSIYKRANDTCKPKSPGLKYRHYAPVAQVSIIQYDNNTTYLSELKRVLLKSIRSLKKIGVFCSNKTKKDILNALNADDISYIEFYSYGKDENVTQAAQSLFSAFRALDSKGVKQIFAPGFAKEGQGVAYMNRLEKSSESKHEKESDDNKKILFVCTGNTCRSPMAESILRFIVEREGPFFVTENDQQQAHIIVSSSGIFAVGGQPAAVYAKNAVHSIWGISLEDHLSQSLNEKMLADSDLVFAVTEEHAHIMRSNYPSYSDKIFALKEYAEKYSVFSKTTQMHANILDPYGQDLTVYEQTATEMYDIIEAVFPYILKDLDIQKQEIK